jgi:putative peptidoglycan lipid II flippase
MAADNPPANRNSAANPSKRGLFGASLRLLPAQLLLRGIEGLLPILLAAWFGRTSTTDILMFTWAWFTMAGALLFTAFHDSALVPITVELRVRRPTELGRFLGAVLAHAIVLGIAIAAVAALLALVVFASRYSGGERTVALAMLVPFAAHMVVMSVRMFFGAVLNSAERFHIPAWVTGFTMLLTLVLLALFREHGVLVVPYAFLAGELLAAGLCAAAVVYGMQLRPQLNFERRPALRELSGLLAAEVGGQVLSRVNPVMDQLVAGLSVVVGAGTIIRYANDVASVPTSLLQAVVLSVLLAQLSIAAAHEDYAAVRSMIRRTLAVMLPLLAGAGVILYLVRVPLLTLLFRHGAMDASGVDEMVRVFPFYLLSMPSFGALLVLYRGTVAVKDSRILPWTGLLHASLTTVFDILLFHFFDIAGIALARVIACTVVAGVFWITLERRLRPTTTHTSARASGSPARVPLQ